MLRIKVFRNAYPDELEKEISRWIKADKPAIQGEPQVAVSDSGVVAVVVSYSLPADDPHSPDNIAIRITERAPDAKSATWVIHHDYASQ